MAVQLPALRKLGEEVGISLEDGVAGLMAGGAVDAAGKVALPAQDAPAELEHSPKSEGA
jgi:hypothetical protein